MKPKVGLKSGSRLQQVPDGVERGFSSAAALLRVQREEDVREGDVRAEGARWDDTRERDGEKRAKKSTGKLVKPERKAREAGTVGREAEVAKSAGIARLEATRSMDAQHSAQAPETEQNAAVATRRPSISLSEYSFHGDSAPAPTVQQAGEVPFPAKQAPRKRAPKSAGAGDGLVAKKPRKTKAAAAATKAKAKSEAIILNSDEPDIPPLQDTIASVEYAPVSEHEQEAAPRAKKPRAKKVKAQTVRMGTEDKDIEATTKASKTSKSRKTAAKAATETSEQSAYFAPPPPVIPAVETNSRHFEPPQLPEHEDAQTTHKEAEVSPTDLVAGAAQAPVPPSPLLLGHAEPAPRRRRDWTPVKDSLQHSADVNERPAEVNAPDATSPTNAMQESESPAPVPLAQLIGNFSYIQPETSAMERTTSGEAMTKRRKLSLSEAPVLSAVAPKQTKKSTAKAPKAPKEPKPPKEKVVKEKKPKSPKKKLQTITAMATAAYRPAAEAVMEGAAQSTVSEFFAPRRPSPPPPAPAETEAPTVAKKPRKPRAKKADVAAADGPAKSTTKGKAKVKFKESEFRPPLVSPTQAAKQLITQDFLFGTSSQLAVEESQTFIREMQVAVRESEATAGPENGYDEMELVTQMETTPTKRSCARVPTAPHGTNLSVGQAERDLWSVSARNGEGGVLVREERVEGLGQADEDGADVRVEAGAVDETIRSEAPGSPPAQKLATDLLTTTDDPINDSQSESGARSAVNPDAQVRPVPQIVPESADPLATSDKVPPQFVDLSHTSPIPEPVAQNADEDETQVDDHGLHDSVMEDQPSKSCFTELPLPASEDDDSWMLLRSEDSVISAGHTTARPATDWRSVEAPLTAQKLSPSPRRAALQPLDANAAIVAHGYLDKISLPSEARAFSTTTETAAKSPTKAPASKRPRGRPRKNMTSTSSLPASPKRPRGRPRKTAASPSDHRPALSQPAEWTNIDEIYDSEPDTPSPPRRRASSQSSPIAPLDFDLPPGSQLPQAAHDKATAKTAALKPTDPDYLSLAPSLHKQITANIRAQPPSNSITHPTWHEKILLYDPIVLEDLTAWLNGQGLHTEYVRPKRGRKKKAQEDETEMVRDELKPWMVQKWCEENSVCCLWKEGLRGGVRGRY